MSELSDVFSRDPLCASAQGGLDGGLDTPLRASAQGGLSAKRPRRVGNYGQIRPFDVANGPGIRVSIFVTGCTHNCPGCFNAEYQDFHAGKPWTETTTRTLIQLLADPVISGLTLLGGEPMQNLWLTDVVERVRAEVETNIWVYSGYTYDQIVSHSGRRSLLEHCDVLVDGLFVEAQKDLRLKFRGSANQRLIDIAASKGNTQPVIIPDAQLETSLAAHRKYCGDIQFPHAMSRGA